MRDFAEIDPSTLPDIREGAAHVVSADGVGSYAGQAVFRWNDALYLIEVKDNDWHVILAGELDENGKIEREAEGVDWLEGRIVNLRDGTVVREFDTTIPDTEIHGPFYAAQRLTDPETDYPDWYKTYLISFIRGD